MIAKKPAAVPHMPCALCNLLYAVSDALPLGPLGSSSSRHRRTLELILQEALLFSEHFLDTVLVHSLPGLVKITGTLHEATPKVLYPRPKEETQVDTNAAAMHFPRQRPSSCKTQSELFL